MFDSSSPPNGEDEQQTTTTSWQATSEQAQAKESRAVQEGNNVSTSPCDSPFVTNSLTMHPPLDRPHPGCEDVVLALKECHLVTWKKFSGGCNSIKKALDNCFKVEKDRLLREMNKDLPEQRKEQEDIIKTAFGKKETFAEFLAKDKDYQKAISDKKEKATGANSK
jgi:COX assembly protein 2